MVLNPPPDPIALWAIPVSDLAGVARHALDVARSGVPGWRLVFLTPPGDLPRELREVGAAVIEQPFGPDHGLRTSVATLRHTVRTLRPEVVHTHLAYADLAAAAALALPQRAIPRPRLVSTEHGIARDDTVYHQSAGKIRAMAAAHAVRVRRFDGLIAVSRATADAMGDKWGARGVEVVPNGVDVVSRLVAGAPRTSTDEDRSLRILSLARLAPEKRLDLLVDAFALLARDHPEATLTLAGTGELESDLRAQVNRLGLSDSVTLPGHVDAVEAMAQHDVLAMLSVWENCSYALLDAANAGLGVVASAVGGNPEILPPQCLVDAADPAAVAKALVAQGLEPAQRPTLTDWPSIEEMCARIAGVYARVTASEAGR